MEQTRRTSGAARRSASGSTRSNLWEDQESAVHTIDTLPFLQADCDLPGSSWLLFPISPTKELTFCPFKDKSFELELNDLNKYNKTNNENKK